MTRDEALPNLLTVFGCVGLAVAAGVSDVSHRGAVRVAVLEPRSAFAVASPAAVAPSPVPTPANRSPLLTLPAAALVTPAEPASLPAPTQMPAKIPTPTEAPAPSPTPTPAAPAAHAAELVEGEPGCGRVALIFNVGVGYEPRLDILEGLKSDGVPATVFPMGQWAGEHPDALRQIAGWGFPIGSHGDQAIALTERPDAEVVRDVEAAAAGITAAAGAPPIPYFTPYAAATDARVQELVARAGFTNVGWRVPAADWDFGVTAQDVLDRVLPNVYDGAIVELHLDAPASAESTGAALPVIVERLRADGYTFVTVPEMASPCG